MTQAALNQNARGADAEDGTPWSWRQEEKLVDLKKFMEQQKQKREEE